MINITYMKKSLFLSPLFILVLVGCSTNSISSNNESISSNNDETSTSDSSSKEIPDPSFDRDVVLPSSNEYKTFWNNTTSLEFTITLSQESANFINNYQYDHDDSTYFDYYVPCTFTYTINGETKTMEDVGIRQKGNMSRTHMLVDGNFSLDSLAHYKLSFKQTFDDEEYTAIDALKPFYKDWSADTDGRKARKKRTLFDMEKIDIKWNRCLDKTKSKQSYALKTFRENGVLAGNDTLALTTLQIEGKESGKVTTVYEVLECIDDVFISRHFSADNANGDLYKCTYTQTGPANFSKSYRVGNQIGAEDNVNKYHPSYDLKTNKKKSNHEALLNFIQIINDKSSSASDFAAKLPYYLDIKGFMKYEAIAYLCGNFDDLRNNANNYYLYFANETGLAYIIPYDFDRCFGAGAEGRSDYMTDFSPESTKMQCNGDWQSINLYWRTVCKNTSHTKVEQVEEYHTLYQKNIEDLLNNKIISVESFTSYVNGFSQSYGCDPNGSGNDNTTFSNYLNKKIQAIKDSNTKGLINYDIKV